MQLPGPWVRASTARDGGLARGSGHAGGRPSGWSAAASRRCHRARGPGWADQPWRASGSRPGGDHLPAGSGGCMLSGAGMSSVGWGGGELPVGARASYQPPGGPPGGGPGTPGPDSPGRWGRHGASGAGGGPGIRPGVVAAGTTQPPSRTARAAGWAAWTTRLLRPTSSGRVGAPPRTGGNRAAAVWSRAARSLCGRGRGGPGPLGREGRSGSWWPLASLRWWPVGISWLGGG